MNQNEPTAALRTIPFFVVDTDGAGVGGITFDAGDVKIRKHGVAWANVAVLPAEVTGGAAGSYLLSLALAETDTAGEMFYSVAHAGIKTLISAVQIDPPAGSFNLDEATAALRTIPLVIVDADGDGVAGITFNAGDSKIHKHGGSWVASANLPTEVTGGVAGAYTMVLATAELDTIGELFYQITHAGIQTYVNAISVAPGVAAVISNVYPESGLPILPSEYIRFDVTGLADTDIVLPMVTLDTLAPPQQVHDGTNFCAGYEGTRTVIDTGFRFTVRRRLGWTSTPTLRIWVGEEAAE